MTVELFIIMFMELFVVQTILKTNRENYFFSTKYKWIYKCLSEMFNIIQDKTLRSYNWVS